MSELADWPELQAELVTNEEVRELCGGITRHTLIAWRAGTTARNRRPFPSPVLTFPSSGAPLELWSRTHVERWLDRGRR